MASDKRGEGNRISVQRPSWSSSIVSDTITHISLFSPISSYNAPKSKPNPRTPHYSAAADDDVVLEILTRDPCDEYVRPVSYTHPTSNLGGHFYVVDKDNDTDTGRILSARAKHSILFDGDPMALGAPGVADVASFVLSPDYLTRLMEAASRAKSSIRICMPD